MAEKEATVLALATTTVVLVALVAVAVLGTTLTQVVAVATLAVAEDIMREEEAVAPSTVAQISPVLWVIQVMRGPAKWLFL